MAGIGGGGSSDLRTRGRVLEPGDPGYDEARSAFNGMVDHRPALIVQCASAQDVAGALRMAGDRALEVSVRGGAHNPSGLAIADGGLMIDLSPLRGVRVDPDARRAAVGGGATVADMDAATQAYGLAAVGGSVSHTGVGGLTLGGGMGWLTRKAGLMLDNLLSAEVVTADGQVLRAAPDEHADLFWAIRGGGGNFGAVTEFEFRLHPVGPIVPFGLFFWGHEQGQEALRLVREVAGWCSPNIGLGVVALTAPPAPFVPEPVRGRIGWALILVGFGGDAEHAEMVARVRGALAPAFELVAPMPYVQVQKFIDETNQWGTLVHDKAVFVEDLTDDVITVLTEYAPRMTAPLSVIFGFRLDGAYSLVGEDETAFGGGRSPCYNFFLVAHALDPQQLAVDRDLVRSLHDALQPLAAQRGGYVNADADTGTDRARATYGAKYERLIQIKARYDPENIFHRNVNIKPT